jgi:spermidine synthase
MNTSFHWRSYTSNLLSADFFTLCKRHLKPAGVFYFNATGSNDAAYTAARVFLHVARYGNFVAASDTPFSMTQQEKVENLRKFVANGKLVFDPSDPNSERVLEEMVTTDVSDQAPLLREQTGPRLVTDDNMATEYPGWYRPAEAWRSRINHLF